MTSTPRGVFPRQHAPKCVCRSIKPLRARCVASCFKIVLSRNRFEQRSVFLHRYRKRAQLVCAFFLICATAISAGSTYVRSRKAFEIVWNEVNKISKRCTVHVMEDSWREHDYRKVPLRGLFYSCSSSKQIFLLASGVEQRSDVYERAASSGS